MNLYVMIARHLGTISGEKIYTYNKMRYMLSQGWEVLFLSCKEETTPCDGKANYYHCVFPALTYTPECYSRRVVQKTLHGVTGVIDSLDWDQCVIESDSANRAIWGELIAKRIGAKHMALLLQESHHYDEETRRFLRFKYDRHELAGITEKSIQQILGDASIELRKDTKFSAYCTNTVEECADEYSPQISNDAKLTFGSLGRLDKGCVLTVLNGFKEFALNHPGENYNVVLIGGTASKKRLEQIHSFFLNSNNIQLYITGYIYPIPVSLLNRIDVFVSTAGSASVSYRFHRPTIKVNPLTGEPCGIMGLDDMNGKTMYDTLPGATVSSCIDRAITHVDDIVYMYHHYDDFYEKMNEEFSRQLKVAESNSQKDYYPEEFLYKLKPSRIKGHQMHRFLGHLLGANGLNRVIDFFRRVIGS